MRIVILWFLNVMLILSFCTSSVLISAEEIEVDELEELETTEESHGEQPEDILITEEEDFSEELFSDSTNSELLNDTETLDSVFYNLSINHVIDDNTLFIEGYAGPNVIVELVDSDNYIIASVTSDFEGYFKFELIEPLSTEESYYIETWNGTQFLSEMELYINQIGIEVPETIYQSTELISGQTSPNRILELKDDSDSLLASTWSDAAGYFELDLQEDFIPNENLSIQVFDEDRLAREVSITVEELQLEILSTNQTEFDREEVPITSRIEITHAIDDNTMTVAGFAKPQSQIKLINKNKEIIQTVQADLTGSFQIKLPNL